MIIDKDKKLTVKQKKFCDYYIETGNGADSARRAGYSARTACVIANDNLSKANVKAYIEERLKQLDSEAIAKQEEALKVITDIIRKKNSKDQDRLRACELLLRVNDAFNPQKTSGDINISIGFEE